MVQGDYLPGFEQRQAFFQGGYQMRGAVFGDGDFSEINLPVTDVMVP